MRPAMSPYLEPIRNVIAAHPDHASLLGAAGYLFRRFNVAEVVGYATRADRLAPRMPARSHTRTSDFVPNSPCGLASRTASASAMEIGSEY